MPGEYSRETHVHWPFNTSFRAWSSGGRKGREGTRMAPRGPELLPTLLPSPSSGLAALPPPRHFLLAPARAAEAEVAAGAAAWSPDPCAPSGQRKQRSGASARRASLHPGSPCSRLPAIGDRYRAAHTQPPPSAHLLRRGAG